MKNMDTTTVTHARANLYKLIEKVDEDHHPVLIMGKKNNAVLISEADWNSINETMYLLAIPGMRESIIEGMAEPLDNCSKTIDW
jgi:antitoxin YefM